MIKLLLQAEMVHHTYYKLTLGSATWSIAAFVNLDHVFTSVAFAESLVNSSMATGHRLDTGRRLTK